MAELYLARHAQASFGAENYDVLSDLGHAQSFALGQAIAAQGVRPDLWVIGDLNRHRETLDGIQRGMGMAPVDRALDILRFSSMPGSSRHHWGTDVDMHSLEPGDFEQGEGARTLAWLRTHARDFGFVEVYTPEANRPGYQPEAWHWSYAPLSVPFLQALNEASIEEKRTVFEGFDGAFLADSVDILGRYVNGVSDEAAGR